MFLLVYADPVVRRCSDQDVVRVEFQFEDHARPHRTDQGGVLTLVFTRDPDS